MASRAEIAELPPSASWTPDQALAASARLPFDHVLIAGFTGDGTLTVRTSRMTRADALYIIECVRDVALHAADDD